MADDFNLDDVIARENAATQPTPEQVREYLDHRGVQCPVCKSHDISGGFVEVDDGGAWQQITCVDCGFVWQDSYKLVAIADEQGKEIPSAPKPHSKLLQVAKLLEDWYAQGNQFGPAEGALLFEDDRTFRDHLKEAIVEAEPHLHP